MLVAALAVAALGGEPVVTSGDALRPGMAVTIEHASPGIRLVTASATGGALQPLERRGEVWSWRLTPAIDATAVELTITEDGRQEHARLEVAPAPASPLGLPPRVEALADGSPIALHVTGAGDAPSLEVALSEGKVASIEPAGAGAFDLTIQPDEVQPARNLLVGVRRAGTDERLAWTSIRLHTRRHLPFSTEPGASLVLEVGPRTYGPFKADLHGLIEAQVDQYPGEQRALAVLSDDLGNQTHSEIALGVGGGFSLAIAPAAHLTEGHPVPPLWVRIVDDRGGAVASPECRTPAGDLRMHQVEPGTWIAVASDGRPVLDEVRVECGPPDSTPAIRHLPADPGGPVHLDLRVWPTELRTDYPVAEVRAVLEDAGGARLPTDGLRLSASKGSISLTSSPGALVSQGEYDGTAAVPAGGDRVVASWLPAPSKGPLERLRLAWGDVPESGSVDAWLQALDPVGRPIEGLAVAVDVGGKPLAGTTTAEGWCHVTVPLTGEGSVLVLRARSGTEVVREALIRGEPSRGAPGEPELVIAQDLTFSAGEAYGISIAVDPPVLRAGPGSFAVVSVKIEDRSGQAVTAAPPSLSAEAGRLGAVSARPDGTWVAEWYAEGVNRPREVQVTAQAGSVQSSTRLEVAPRSLTTSIGPWIGGITNFGEVTSAAFGLDVDFRFRSGWLGDAVALRIGGSAWGFTSTTDPGLGATPIALHTLMFPIGPMLVFRRETGRTLLSGGIGGVFALERIEARTPGSLITRGFDGIVGPELLAGVARNVGTGEIGVNIRGTWLPAGGGELGYTGNVGGVSGDLSYRLNF
jgi:hypothetical protein